MKYCDFEFRTENFEGPLDLLWHLIKKNKIDIYDIPISKLADQFLQYIENSQDRSLESRAEFLTLASDLFELKSRMLLPLPKESDEDFIGEEDPRKELIERLLEYKKVLRRRERLEDLYLQFSDRYFREDALNLRSEEKEEPQDDVIWEDALLVAAMNDVILNMGEIDFVRNRFFEKLRTMQDRQISVEGKSHEILHLMNSLSHTNISFEQLLIDKSLSEIIVTFLAVLELMKSGQLLAVQVKNDIVLNKRTLE